MTVNDVEIVARTILKEGYEEGSEAYQSVAWVIYNRMMSGQYPNNARQVCLQQGQFPCWKSSWTKEATVEPDKAADAHRDYHYCVELAQRVCHYQPPNSYDPIDGRLFFREKEGEKEDNRGEVDVCTIL